MGTYESDFCVSRVSTPSFKQGQGFRNEFLQTQCWSPSSPESLTSLTGRQCVTTFTAVYTGNRLKLDHNGDVSPTPCLDIGKGNRKHKYKKDMSVTSIDSHRFSWDG